MNDVGINAKNWRTNFILDLVCQYRMTLLYVSAKYILSSIRITIHHTKYFYILQRWR